MWNDRIPLYWPEPRYAYIDYINTSIIKRFIFDCVTRSFRMTADEIELVRIFLCYSESSFVKPDTKIKKRDEIEFDCFCNIVRKLRTGNELISHPTTDELHALLKIYPMFSPGLF
jgi:hypothetical protein